MRRLVLFFLVMSAEIEKKISDQLYETLETVFGYLELGMIEKADAENLFA